MREGIVKREKLPRGEVARLEAVRARAAALLDHLEELPAVAGTLPFTVSYLLWRLRVELGELRGATGPGRRALRPGRRRAGGRCRRLGWLRQGETSNQPLQE